MSPPLSSDSPIPIPCCVSIAPPRQRLLPRPPITGLNVGETVLGVDSRPANGLLYGVTTQNRLVTINATTGAATSPLLLTADPADLTSPFTALSGTAFGVDFNPVPDRLRVVSDTNQNLRINVTNGFVTTDTDITPVAADIVASAYLNDFAGATATTLYDLDAATETLFTQNPPNNGTLVSVGSVGPNLDVTPSSGFDIVTTGGGLTPRVDTAYATLVNTTTSLTGLYTINLTTGAATLVGTIGTGALPVRGLAVIPAGTLNFSVGAVSVNENGGSVMLSITRTGGSLGAVSVDFTTTNGTATSGSDFTAPTMMNTVMFADGDTATKTVSIPILNDASVEGTESFLVNLSNATGGAVIGSLGTAQVNIQDAQSPRTVLYAVTVTQNLLTLDSASPSTILSTTAIQGLGTGEVVEGIDVRPLNGKLYGLIVNGTAARLVTIDPTTGATVQVGATFTISGVDFGFDFNPVLDRIRVVSDTGMNLSVNPDTAVVTTQSAITGGTPDVVGSAYTNSFAGANSTSLYAIDAGTDSLYTQNPPANGVLTLVGALGVDTSGMTGFDIGFNNQGFASLTTPGGTASQLYTVNLATGAASLLGTIGGGQVINDVAIAPAGFLNFSMSNYTVAENGGQATITVTRTGGSGGSISASYTITDGTATAGADYLASSGTVNFADGDTTPKTFTVFIVNNTVVNPDKTVNLTLSNPVGGFLGPVTSAILTIINDDVAPTPPPPSNLTQNQKIVNRLFNDILRRNADPTGLAGFSAALDQGVSVGSVVRSILGSVEYRTNLVQGLYQSLLGRPADVPGLQGFVNFLATGTQAQVTASLIGSAEYFQRNGGTNSSFLSAVYRDILFRQIDPQGLSSFSAQLSQGQSRAQVTMIILTSAEGLGVRVNSLYLQFLKRNADASGLNNFSLLLQLTGREEDVIVSLASSAEYVGGIR